MIPFPDVSPEIFSFNLFGLNLALRWYALSYIIGFICALQIMKFYIRRDNLWIAEKPPFESEQADSLLTYLIIGVIVGGRLMYVLFYNLGYYLENPIDNLRLWDGCMAFHGGFIGVVVAVFIYFRSNSIPIWSGADLIAIATPPGLFFGRLANFVNAELWGRPTDVPWGVIFPGELAQLCDGILGPCARHPSQLYEAFLEGIILFLLLIYFRKKNYLLKPGTISGLFLIFYSIFRFFVEFYRVPDEHIGYLAFNLSTGQIVSVVFLIIGTIVFYLKNENK